MTFTNVMQYSITHHNHWRQMLDEIQLALRCPNICSTKLCTWLWVVEMCTGVECSRSSAWFLLLQATAVQKIPSIWEVKWKSLCVLNGNSLNLRCPPPSRGDTQSVSHYPKVDNLTGKVTDFAKRVGKQMYSESLPGCTWVWLDGGYSCSTSGGSPKIRCLKTLQITNENAILKQLGQQGWPSLRDEVLL